MPSKARAVGVLAVALVVLAAAPGSAAAAGGTIETPTNATAIAANGVTTIDYDTDGAADEIVYIDPTGFEVKVYEPSSEQIYSLSANDAAAAIAVGDATGNGNDDVLYRDGNDNLHLLQPQQNSDFEASIKITGDSLAVGANDKAWVGNKTTGNLSRINWSAQTQAGLATDTGVPIDDGTPISVNTAAGAGNDRVAFTGADGDLKLYNNTTDTVTTSGVTGTNASFGDVDGDTETEVVFTDGSDELRVWNYTQPGSTPTSTGVAAQAVSAGDVTGDGTTEVAITTPAGGTRVVDLSGDSVTGTDIGGGGAVAVAEVNGDGAAEVIGVDDTSLEYYDSTVAPATVSNVTPSGDTAIDETVTLSAQINDSDFATHTDEEVAVELVVDGSTVVSKTLASNGTVSTTYSLGETGAKDYEIRATDRVSTTTDTRTLVVPENLTIRNESAPAQIINASGAAEVRFFASDGTVYSRSVTNGTVSFVGLPADQRFEATLDIDGYRTRQVIIQSLIEQQNAFVLPTNASTVEVVFEIESPTGEFAPDDTILFVQRPITLNNTTEYKTVSASTFGASGQYPADMITGERYRLQVAAEDGSSSRSLGSYRPVASRVETLQVQRVEPRSNADAGQVVYGGLTDYNNQTAVAVRHRDLGDTVDSVEYRIEDANGTVIVPNTTKTADEFAAVYPVDLGNTTNATVYYETTLANGSTVSGSFSTGAVAGPVGRFGADPQVLSIVSWVAILATMGLLVIINTDIAPVGAVAVATGLTILGTVAIPLPILGLSGVLAALNAFGGGVGR